MQIARQFDRETLRKMGISFLLIVGGTALNFIADNLIQLIGAVGIPKEWYGITIPACTWLLNTAKEWLAGQ